MVVSIILLILLIVSVILYLVNCCKEKRSVFSTGIIIGISFMILILCCIATFMKTTIIKTKTVPEIETTITYGVEHNDTTYTYIFYKE